MTRKLVTFHFDQLGEPRESRPPVDRVIEGDIVCRNWDIDSAKDGKVRAGVFESTPGTNRSIKGETWEFCYILSGVAEITDAMILARLFTELFSKGCILVATSNVEPDNLYKDGLNREHFLPFIALIERELDVVPLNGPVDYRLDRIGGLATWQAKDVLSRHEALQLMTRGSAWMSGEEEVKGRLVEGQYADFAVLSDDPLAVPAEEIAAIEVRETWVDGVRRHAM